MSCLFLVVHIAVDVAVSIRNLDLDRLTVEDGKSYVLLDEFVYSCEDILMSFYVLEGVWPVLFNPILRQS